jgi:hypothetical protein
MGLKFNRGARKNKRAMPQKQPVSFILIIRMPSGLILIAVWIILRPRQNIGGALMSLPEREKADGMVTLP